MVFFFEKAYLTTSFLLKYQPRVIGAHLTPTGFPNREWGEGGDFIQRNQLSFDTSWLGISRAVRQPWGKRALVSQRGSALPHSGPGLWDRVELLHLRRHSLKWKPKVHPDTEGSWLTMDRSLSLVPDWSVLMHMKTPTPHILIGPRSTVLIGQNGVTLIG